MRIFVSTRKDLHIYLDVSSFFYINDWHSMDMMKVKSLATEATSLNF